MKSFMNVLIITNTTSIIGEMKIPLLGRCNFFSPRTLLLNVPKKGLKASIKE